MARGPYVCGSLDIVDNTTHRLYDDRLLQPLNRLRNLLRLWLFHQLNGMLHGDAGGIQSALSGLQLSEDSFTIIGHGVTT